MGVFITLMLALLAVGLFPQRTMSADKQDPAVADLKQNILKERVAGLEQIAKDRPFSLPEMVRLADMYSTLNQTGKLYSTAAKIAETLLAANPTNYPAAIQYRAAVIMQKAGKIEEMERILDACTTHIPKNAPENAYLEIAGMYGAAKKPAKAVNMLERYLVTNPKIWQVWIELATRQISLGKESEAILSLERAVQIDKPDATLTISQNPFLNSLWLKNHNEKEPSSK